MTGMPGWFPPRGGITRENAHLFYEVSDECWGARGIPDRGYVRIRRGGRRQFAHRAMYELFVGPIPDGLHIDHLCCVRNCMNPTHLEAVTPAENQHRMALRKTHCIHGHAFDAANTYIRADGVSRTCKTCDRNHRRRYRAIRKAATRELRAAA